MDGDQALDFCWIDPIDAAIRLISKSKFAGKLYTKYERLDSVWRPGKRAFGRANSGLVFQSAQNIADSVFHCCSCFMQTNHILASTDRTIQYKVRFNLILNLFIYTWNYPISYILVSVLNFRENERQKPENWIPIGWMPSYDNDLTKRPTKVNRLGKFGCFMTAFATSWAIGIIKANQRKTFLGVIKYVDRRGFF